MRIKTLLSLTLPLALLACGRPVTESDVKFAGVGLDPDEIGPIPEYYGGYVELDLINFGGAGLSLGTVGFRSHNEVGPSLFADFEPPYSLVYGLSFMFDDLVPAPDVHHGSIGVGPEVEGTDACWTNKEAVSFLMASTVELGSELRFANEDGSVAFNVGRFPEIYPPNPQDVFVYYSTVESYRPNPVTHWAPQSDGSWAQEQLVSSNWAPGETLSMSYGGGLPPLEAPVSAIPLPSTSVDLQSFTLPSDPSDLSLIWNGEAYDTTGLALGEQAWKTCVQYVGTPEDPATFDTDCTQQTLPAVGGVGSSNTIEGQYYTGPWDTSDGQVTFNWDPAAGMEGEKVTLNIRFLGPVDRNDDGFLEPVVVTSDGSVRDPMTCDNRASGLEYRFDETLVDRDGNLPSTLQGDPAKTLAEVSCSLEDDGEFSLTMEHLQSALDYAQAKGGEGVVFYFSRGTTLEATVPPVRDQAQMKREISPVLVRANSVTLGRFWLEDPSDLKPEGN